MTAEHDDPISAASAGLRALGVAPRRRVETLGLLAALVDLADDSGAVPLDHALIATEERLGIDACLEGYEWLERLDVIRRTFAGWTIQNFASHHGPAGMTAASMAVLQRHLAASAEATIVVTTEPAPAELTAPIVALKPWRRRIPAMAAGVAAGIAVLTGVSQFAPQAAVSGRSAAVQTEGTARAVAEPDASVTTPATSGAVAAAPSGRETPHGAATTSTTSTTLLPGLPCLSRAVNDLASRTGLDLGRDSSATLPPGVLACP